MQIVTVNVLAVLVATVAAFLVSGFLHGVVFKGTKVGTSKKKMTPEIIGVSIIATFLMYYVLAHVLAFAETANWMEGMQGAFWMWLGFIAPLQIAVKYTNDLPWKTFLVNTTCMLASLLVGSAILGAW